MDIDSPIPSYISFFDLSPSTFPFRSPRPEQIELRRAVLADLLIFDILLSMGGIRQPDTLYPPSDPDTLKTLLEAIEVSTYDILKKDCLVYFLLKWHEDGREEGFREDKCIPPQFVALADAYWYLDTGSDVAKAVSILSDARINRDYASKILQAISHSQNPSPLIVKYIRTAKPLLTEPDDINMYALALAESNLFQAWQFQRTFPEDSQTRPAIVNKILDWCLSPKPRSQPLAQLLALPFSPYEQSLVHAYALSPPSTCPPSSIHVVQDLVCVRLVQSGLYAAAVKLDRQFTIHPGASDGKSTQVTYHRRRMMDDIMSTIPAVEREVLEAELEEVTRGKNVVNASTSNGNGDLSMSWEDVGSVNGSAKAPTASIPERAGAPRFGGNLPAVPLASNGKAPLRESLVSATRRLFESIPVTAKQLPQPFVSGSPSFLAPNLKSNYFISTLSNRAVAPSINAIASASLPAPSRSANLARNAFYNPPPMNGRAIPSPPANSTPNDVQKDITMEPEEELAEEKPDATEHNESELEVDEAAAELSFSLFRESGPKVVQEKPKTKQLKRTETQRKMPPGAFMDEPEETEDELASVRVRKLPRKRSPSPPPPQKVSRAKTRKGPDLGRSLPGSLMDEDEGEEEEEDIVSPLPTSPPAKRKSRASRVTNEVKEPIKPRRSSRLSVASSSPEPLSPPKSKPRKSTRLSTGTKKTSKKRS